MLKQYKEAIEQSNIISKTDTAGIITFVNDEFCQISGYTKEELLGQNHNIVRHPDVPAANFKLLWNTIKQKKTYKATVKNKAKNGSTFYVNTTVIPILDKNKDIKEYVAIRYDVTKEMEYKSALEEKEKELEELNKNLEKKVKEQTKELQDLNKNLEKRVQEEISKNDEKQKIMFWQSRLASLGQMIANISHQWRQPLTELNLAIFNIKKSAQNAHMEDILSYHSESKAIIKNMSDTIDDFANFFKPDKEKKYFCVEKSINEAIQILQNLIIKEKICIKTNFEDVKVLGIPNELSQVIINLIQNSKDAFNQSETLQKEIRISTYSKDNHAIISVKDNAGGVDPKKLDKIFEPYFTTKHSTKGTGLGLFMSKMICEQGLSGSIEVKNISNGIETIIKIPIGDDYGK